MKRAPCLSWLLQSFDFGKPCVSQSKTGHQVSTESKQGSTYMPDGRRSSPASDLAHAPCASDNQSPVLRVSLARIFARKQSVLPIDSCTLAEGTAGKPKPCQISEEKWQSQVDSGHYLPFPKTGHSMPNLPECQVHYGKEASTPWQAPINSQSSGLPTEEASFPGNNYPKAFSLNPKRGQPRG